MGHNRTETEDQVADLLRTAKRQRAAMFPRIRSCVSVPVTLSDGTSYVTFCAAGFTSDRQLSKRDQALMGVLAQAAATVIEPGVERQRRELPWRIRRQRTSEPLSAADHHSPCSMTAHCCTALPRCSPWIAARRPPTIALMVFEESVVLYIPFDEALAAAKAAFAEVGFGTLTEIDIQATLEAKIGTQMGRYVIVGACNPGLAARALDAEPQIGVLLPCNVVVRERDEHVVVEAMDPGLMADIVGTDAVRPIADEARRLVGDALERLAATS